MTRWERVAAILKVIGACLGVPSRASAHRRCTRAAPFPSPKSSHFTHLRHPFHRARRRRLGSDVGRRGEGERRLGRRREPVRPNPLVVGVRKEAVIAIHLAHEPDHPVDRLEIALQHFAAGDEHRLVQAIDLQRQIVRRGRRGVPGEDGFDEDLHPPERHPLRGGELGRQKPRLSKSTIRLLRAPLFRRAFRRASIDRSRRGAGGCGTASSNFAMGNSA